MLDYTSSILFLDDSLIAYKDGKQVVYVLEDEILRSSARCGYIKLPVVELEICLGWWISAT